MSRILVLGSGIGGSTAAHALAELGHQVEMLEPSDRFGGKVVDYCCKATEECSRCGVCIATTQLHQSLRHPRIRVHVGARLESLSAGPPFSARIRQASPAIDYRKCIGCDACVAACPTGSIARLARGELVQYRVDPSSCRARQGQVCRVCANVCPAGAITVAARAARPRGRRLDAEAVLVATGHQPYPARAKARLGYGRLDGVMTGAEAEELLSHRRTFGEQVRSVAFVQCVGSRDPKEGRNYCSAVCCAYALRLARMLKHASPETEITIYYIDIQNIDKTFTLLRRELQDGGIRFVRGVPSRVEQSAAGRLQLLVENPDGQCSEVEHDRVVLSVGMLPAPESEALIDELGLDRDRFGFLAVQAASARTNRPAVYACGTCREPLNIPDTMAAARAAAGEIHRDLAAESRRAQAPVRRGRGGR